jgi:hypothetical protein
LLRPDGRFADFGNTTFDELAAIVDGLPVDEADYPGLRVGDAGIKVKRWYVEGYERFDADGALLRCDPKGIEVRTAIHPDIAGTVGQLGADLDTLAAAAARTRFRVVTIGFNPWRNDYPIEPPLNAWELAHRQQSPEDRSAHVHMTTYGPDLNLSWDRLGPDQLVDAGAKLTFYSPYIVPFSFSSPFAGGRLWGGLSRRTFVRTGIRPATMVFLADHTRLLDTDPSLTQPARIPAEDGRIEFKAFDPCPDLALYAELLTLLTGLLTDDTLAGRRLTPDAGLHQVAARTGHRHPYIRAGAERVLDAVRRVLPDADDQVRLDSLSARLDAASCPAREMIERYRAGEAVAGLRAA